MFSKDEILSRLRSGDSMDTIADEIAKAMNEAEDDYVEELKIKQAEANRQDIIRSDVRKAVKVAIDWLEVYYPSLFMTDKGWTDEEIDKLVDDILNYLREIEDLTQWFHKMLNCSSSKSNSSTKNSSIDDILRKWINSI